MKTRKGKNRRKGGRMVAEKPKPYCQCSDFTGHQGCTAFAIKDSLFCENHQHCPGSPRSGSEPKFDPMRYNKDAAAYKSHNCYSYSMNVLDKKLVELCRRKGENYSCRQNFHQPGALNGARYALNASERRQCPVVEKLMIDDTPQIEKTDFYSKCPKGKSKIALVVDPGEDYHFYRQDSDGMWSHKDGSNKVKRYDALKRPIFNPKYASRDYEWQGSDLNYTDFCGFYCVPRDHDIHLGQGGALRLVKRGGSHKGSRIDSQKSSRKGSRKVSRKQRFQVLEPPGQSWTVYRRYQTRKRKNE